MLDLKLFSLIRHRCGTGSCYRKAEPVSTVSTKPCSACGKVREAKWFFVNKGKRTGLGSRCMPCSSLYDEQRRNKIKAQSQAEQQLQPAEKQCRVCERLLPIGDFTRSYANLGGCASECKECKRKLDVIRYAKRKERFGGQPPGSPPPDVHICTVCKQIKAVSEFYATKRRGASSMKTACKTCSAMNCRSRRDRRRVISTSETSAGDALPAPER